MYTISLYNKLFFILLAAIIFQGCDVFSDSSPANKSIRGHVQCNNIPLEGAVIYCGSDSVISAKDGSFTLSLRNSDDQTLRVEYPPLATFYYSYLSHGSSNIVINLVDNLIPKESFFPIQLGDSLGYSYVHIYSNLSGSVTHKGKIMIHVVKAAGSRQFPSYVLNESFYDSSKASITFKTEAYLEKMNADSIRLSAPNGSKLFPDITPTIIPILPKSPNQTELYYRSYFFKAGSGLQSMDSGGGGSTQEIFSIKRIY